MNRSPHRTGKSILLAISALVLALAFPARAQNDPQAMATQVHYLLKQASDPADTDRLAHLQSALGILKDFPPGHYRGRRGDAMRDVHDAIDDLKSGDADHKVDDYIRDADSAVRDIEG